MGGFKRGGDTAAERERGAILKIVKDCDTEAGVWVLKRSTVWRLLRFRSRISVCSMCKGPGQSNDKRVCCVGLVQKSQIL